VALGFARGRHASLGRGGECSRWGVGVGRSRAHVVGIGRFDDVMGLGRGGTVARGVGLARGLTVGLERGENRIRGACLA
jgi:hypothetical protein